MNRREAKRAACRHVANLIDSQLAVGWDTINTKDFGGIYDDPEDVVRITDALGDLIDELDRRGKT